MADKKLTTAEILALARQKDRGAASGAPDAKPEATQPESPAAESPQLKPAGKPAARPTSTADILAAARAQKTGGATAAVPKTKPKPAAKEKSAPVLSSSGDRPSVQEMLKRVRAEKETLAADVGPKLPPLPRKPAPSKVRVGPRRRNFLVAMVATPFALAWTAFTASAIAGTLACARVLMPNAVAEPPSKFKIGTPDDYPVGTVSTKWKAEYAIWITHQIYNGKSELYALSTVCTHLGCTPNWLEGERKFKCPCHGSGFYADGINFEGPAPRPLERYGISVASDGMLEVDKSVKFQQELGQWDDAASYVAAS